MARNELDLQHMTIETLPTIVPQSASTGTTCNQPGSQGE